MKRVFFYSIALFLLTCFFYSCTISHTAVISNNPVGSKMISRDYTNWDSKQGATYQQLMSGAKITKIGIAEYKSLNYLFFTRNTITITGE